MQAFEWVFGRSKTPQERLRIHQRALEKSQRELERERVKLEAQEKRLITDIKKSAKAGQVGAAKIKARDLVRTRKHIQKFYSMRTQLQAVSLRIQTVRSNEQMMQSMKGATRLLSGMNKSMNMPALSRIAADFERENEIMDQRGEMMDEAIDDTMEDDEEESDEILNQVLDEIGVDLTQQLGEAPTGFAVPQTESRVPQAQAMGGGGTDDDLQARLNNLKGDD
ncbi:protein of unknown function [Taphrina deformans PYCC 5710]|uniref:SNF7 family protein n=1 Tax=Taphrina deformans (strain PYCC 5710 / ATCC 11124 / CBS 356.35 / IMI 108563 / JCM 9778 / NBRC 8474) TaxID=1097556 RepID=R4XGH4_TAPDE|nr:protein of unknown function [Taphrina deformans PYCC 5710]|eukprot:CCG84747.1 protein of unknown function [Taphrina deformans PYCC 5710]